METITPGSRDEARSAIRDHDRVVIIGNGSKPSLTSARTGRRISTINLTGMMEYEPSEFTFTALAGTPVRAVAAELATRGQYLPFDPILVGGGATLGGTVAAGLSGPGRFRYGGVRDFLLGAEIVLGNGDVVRVGGKVVKNAAGFDVPKLIVGSLGGFGLITQMTMKVFPRPVQTQTLCQRASSHADALAKIAIAAGSPWELDAIDYHAEDRTLWLRLGGPTAALASQIDRIGSVIGDVVSLSTEESDARWSSINELTWVDSERVVIKVSLTAKHAIGLIDTVHTAGGNVHLSAAANVAWVGIDDDAVASLDQWLCQTGLSGLIIRSTRLDRSPRLGLIRSSRLAVDLQNAFDPSGRFIG